MSAYVHPALPKRGRIPAKILARMSRPLPDEANPKPAPGVLAKNATTGEAGTGGGVDEDSHKQKGGLVSKYRAVKTTVDGITFASKAEAKRYQELKALCVAGHILNLKCQPVFVLADSVTINGRRRPSLRYVADFSYYTPDMDLVVEDVKGMLTPVYRLKRHLMKAVLGIDIVEIAAGKK